jgi:DNA methylase
MSTFGNASGPGVQRGSLGSGAGKTKSGGGVKAPAGSRHWNRSSERNDHESTYEANSGSAVRFFPQFAYSELDDLTPFLYAPKASRAERDAGLEHFRPRSAAELTDSDDGQARLASPRTGAGRTGGARNPHPTIKPWQELLRWCVRLVTPKGGRVLDSFAGACSCGLACLAEGFGYIGIELNDTDEEPYVSIGRARLHFFEGREFVPRESLRSADPPKQGSLFTKA